MLLFCFIYANFPPVVIIIVLRPHVFTEFATTSQHSSISSTKSNNQGWVQSIYQWCNLHFALILYSCWLYSLILFHIIFYLQLLFIYEVYIQIMQQYHKTSTVTTEGKGIIHIMFLLHCFIFVSYFYLFILQIKFFSKIITTISFDATKYYS